MTKKVVFWLTGLSGAGKTTLAQCLYAYFNTMHIQSYVIDGDEIRKTICDDLTFSEAARSENSRRVSHICNILLDCNVVPIVSLISPRKEYRQKAKEVIKGQFIEVYVQCPIETCIKRDVKGLYKKVDSGEIQNFTGISASYEAPESPDITIPTNEMNIKESVALLLDYWESIK